MDTQTEITTVALTKCRTEPAVALYAAAPVSGYGHADDIVTYSFDLPESIAATVKSGSVVGTATVYLDGDEVGTVDLVTHREMSPTSAPTPKPQCFCCVHCCSSSLH